MSPQSLRAGSGDTLTGSESTNGTTWTSVGTTNQGGLPATVQIGLFVTSPFHPAESQGGSSSSDSYSPATAAFDHVSVQGTNPGGTWIRADVGVNTYNGKPYHPGSLVEANGTFSVTGNGDIGPLGDQNDQTIQTILIGALAGLIVVIIIAVLFVAAEYSGGRTRFIKRISIDQRALAAKTLLFGLVTFLTQLVAITVAVEIGKRILLANGGFQSVSFLIELHLIAGTAATIALVAVFALAFGALFRRRIIAMAVALVLTAVPFILALLNLVPDAVSQWLLSFTPAAGFAIQQGFPAYPQVIASYTLLNGYYPLDPWAGFAVLCGYTLQALGLAFFVPGRREAMSKQAIQV